MMKRTDDIAKAEYLLDDCLYVTLSMIDINGTPYCIPLSPARKGNLLYFHCGLKGHKLDALRAHPEVCLTCVGKAAVVPGQFTIDYESLVAFGTAVEVLDSDEKIEALKLICEKYCLDDMGDFQKVLDHWLPRTGIWKITLDGITTKG